jgi:hypothetical protein
MDHLPLDLVSRVLSFLDGESLLTCASVCKDFCQLTDQRSYWENAAWRLYPHLKETYDIMPYNGDWKALFKDRNRRNRSAVFEWTVTDFLSNPERRYSPSFRVENYTFKVIVDPVGNPNVYFLEPGVSVYLACSLAPPASAAAAAAPAAPALALEGAEGANNDGDGGNAFAAAAAANDGGAGAAAAAAAAASDWECCCAFSLTACNQQRKGRNVTWHSSMLNDRFHKNRKNWGVHSLLPLTKLKDPASGFVVDDSLKLKVRLRLLYLTVKVIRTGALAAHQGFGVVDTAAEAEASGSTLCYELFHCTTLAKFNEMLVKDLGLPSPDHLRLWVFTQPWPDTVLCPREILVNEPVSSNANNPNGNGGGEATDDDLSSPTLFSLLQLHMDGLGVARVWAETSEDGGFAAPAPMLPTTAVSSTEAEPMLEEADGASPLPSPSPAPAAGSQASSTAMVVGPLPGLQRYDPAQPLLSVPLWPDSRDASAQQAAMAAGPGPSLGPAAASSPPQGVASPDMHVLLFLKYLDPRSGCIRYLTHAVCRVHTPLHHLFSLVAGLVGQPAQALAAHVETTPANWQPGSLSPQRAITCPPGVADSAASATAFRSAEGGAAGGLTVRDAGLENGQILTFHVAGAGMGEALGEVYRGYLEDLFREAYVMYYGDTDNAHTGKATPVPAAAAAAGGPDRRELALARHKRRFGAGTLKLEDVVNLFERFGYQSFRVRNVYYQHKHMNARQTLEYVIQGRHLGFCCDRCGVTDFTGPRYKCMACYDYDLCCNCQGKRRGRGRRANKVGRPACLPACPCLGPSSTLTDRLDSTDPAALSPPLHHTHTQQSTRKRPRTGTSTSTGAGGARTTLVSMPSATRCA